MQAMEMKRMSKKRLENPSSSTLTQGLKRKRGRPKKQPQEGGVSTATIPQDAEEPEPVKKPRGRPKGSKKITVLTGETPQAVVQEESQGGNPLESNDLNLNSSPATQDITGKPLVVGDV